jgi:hypothetical protein
VPVICADCQHETTRYVTKFHSGGARTTCHTCEHPVHSSLAANPYADLTIEHVVTEDGKPLRVTSKRQLLEAEKKYHFRSLVAHTDEANFDKPPQQATGSVADFMTREKKWMYPEVAQAMLREVKEKGIDINTW